MRVLIILGHPRKDSFCAALANEFCSTLSCRNIEFRQLKLVDLTFDLHVRHAAIHNQPLELHLQQAREWITWADHIVFIYPIWWGTMPALLKGFLDRVLLPGFAFKEREFGSGYEGLLVGKSAQLLTTMDTPPWVVRWILRRPGHRVFDITTLRFCGIRPVRNRMFGPIKSSSAQRRLEWLEAASREANLIRGGKLRGIEAWRDKAAAWVKALRLPFYPMSWLAYTAGAALTVPTPVLWKQPAYWWGYAVIFMIEAITVFVNEVYDFETDRRNPHYGPFNGGSRILVERRLTKFDLKIATITTAVGASLAAVFVLSTSPGQPWAILGCFLITVFLGIGYTLPPFKFCHRGAGEVVVAFTHSLLVIQWGALVLGGGIATWPVWQLGLPLFFAVLPSIILSGLPDRDADAGAGKCSLAVKFGAKGAIAFAIAATSVSAALAMGWGRSWPPWSIFAMVMHALALIALAAFELKPDGARRIDGVIFLSLSYMLWFAVVPLLAP